MKKIILTLLTITLFVTCTTKKQGNMLVKGTVDGLKKGTLYLQKFNDTLLVSVDSIQLSGTSDFMLSHQVNSPEMYYLVLGKGKDKTISFFGEKGEITINTKLSKFSTSAKITGSKNQILWEEHNNMAIKFSGKRLDLIKEKFEAQKNKDKKALLKVEALEKNLIKRKYYYTTNFSVKNGNHEIAPYLALTELYNANIQLLDTVNNSLSKQVKTSKYGVALSQFIKDIKANEK